MIVRRFLAAAVGVPALLGVCWWGAGPFAVTVTVIAAIGGMELIRAHRNAGVRPNVVLATMGLFGPALPLLVADGPGGSQIPPSALLSLMIGIFLTGLIVEVMVAQHTERAAPLAGVGAGLSIAAYTALFGGVSLLRSSSAIHGRPAIDGAEVGFCVVLLVLCAVWATDSAAYFVGRGIGSVRLSPTLSPHKTVEGAIGGFIAAVVVGAVLGHLLLERAVLGWWIGAVAGIAGQVGDLYESAMKRELKVKDFGSIIPGHGGVLDRFDSLLFVAPVVWLLTHVFS